MRRAFVLALAALLAHPAAAQEPASEPAAGDDGAATTEELFSGHAASDEQVAATARQAMPFTEEQIQALGILLQQVRAATAEAAGPVPEPRHRRLQIHPGHAGLPAVALAKGYTTAISFVDATGAPWPIEEVLVDASFLPAQAGQRPDGAQHLLYLAPSRANLHGNAVVKLLGRTDPVILTLADGGETADVRLDIRLAEAGPDADPEALAAAPRFQAGDETLLDLLAGIAPAGTHRLVVSGGYPGDRAWAEGEDVLLVTAGTILTPGPWAAERAADGRWAYRLPATPFALVSAAGVDYRVDFRTEAAAATLEEILE